MTDWLDSWTKTRKLPPTFLAAKRWAAHVRSGVAQVEKPKPKYLSYDDSMYIMRHGKKAWREWVRLRDLAIPKSVPIEYADPKAQAAFEAVYKNRLHMLRVQPKPES